MNDEIMDIASNIKDVIVAEIPNNKNEMLGFIVSLDEKFPNTPRTVRTVFEQVYEEKFKEKYVW